ncbi:unnamed protein product [Urochloa humidicola]
MMIFGSRMFNDAGIGPDRLQQFRSRMNENARNLLILAAANWIMAFLEGYCWARTAERQASRMRGRYLRAVLRQDVDRSTSTSTPARRRTRSPASPATASPCRTCWPRRSPTS